MTPEESGDPSQDPQNGVKCVPINPRKEVPGMTPEESGDEPGEPQNGVKCVPFNVRKVTEMSSFDRFDRKVIFWLVPG